LVPVLNKETLLDKKRMTREEAIRLKDTFPETPDKAIAQGFMYFTTGVACNNGHYSPRSITSERRCVECLQEKNRKQQAGPLNWIYVARAAERKARKRAKDLGCLPEGYDKRTCQEFYLLAAILSQEHGEPHVVDHRMPLSRGGLHHPDNLLVVTREVNLGKGEMTEVTYHQKLVTADVLVAISYGHSIGERL
jgi:hypothetical protein